MKSDDLLKKLREVLGIEADQVVDDVVKIDQDAAAAGVATKEVDPLQVLSDLQGQIAALSASVAEIKGALGGYAQKELVDQAIAASKRSDDVLAQVRQLFAQQGAASGTGRKESDPLPEQKKALEDEKKALNAGADNPWITQYQYQGGK